MLTIVRVRSLSVAAMILCALFVYDIFWVFFSEGIFGGNVMVTVATKEATNVIGGSQSYLVGISH